VALNDSTICRTALGLKRNFYTLAYKLSYEKVGDNAFRPTLRKRNAELATAGFQVPDTVELDVVRSTGVSHSKPVSSEIYSNY